MASLAMELHSALPHLSLPVRLILDALVLAGGRIHSADRFANSCGLRSRYQLAGLLRRDGLPQIEELTGWISVLLMLLQGETSALSLYRWALEHRQCPPTCYRVVKRVTGTTWCRVRAEGFQRLLERFVARCDQLQCASQLRKADPARWMLLENVPTLPLRPYALTQPGECIQRHLGWIVLAGAAAAAL
jgi:hypothetical protein